MPRVTLVQPGARHNYALARFLDEEGMLQRLYTDFAIGRGDPLRALLRLPLGGHARAKLARRTTDALPADLVRCGVGVALGRLGARDLRSVTTRDVAESDAFYLQYFAAGADLRRRAPDKPIVSDVFIVPGAYRELNREIAAFPDWGEQPVSIETATLYDRFAHGMLDQSDVLFCPSQAVIDDVAGYGPACRNKCRLVPYGASLAAAAADGVPEPGRVLFCGSVQLRKGVPYIRMAADRLAVTHPHIRFVFAGGVTATVRERLAAPNITVLGHLGKDALVREFGRADLFLFPSLAEGSAGATLEALASGLPIVGTRAGGVDFTDGVSGIVVPPRDPDAIAAAVVRVVEDRPLRDAMSANALREAKFYSMAAWKARFVAAMRDVV